MNILAIKFDLNWFLTIPGMLITGGILLLLIALIIFIATSGGKKKDKKDVKELVDVNEGAQQVASPESAPIVNEVNPGEIPPVAPVTLDPTTSQPVTSEVVEPAMTTPIEPVVPVVPEPTVTVEEVANDVSNSDISPNFIPPVQETSMPEIQPQETIPQDEPAVSIYGGVSPIVPNVQTEPVERQIYGGANPMDATQSIPIVEPTPHVEYGVPVEEKPVEQPISEENKENDITNIQPIAVPTETVPTLQEESPIPTVTEPVPAVEEQPVEPTPDVTKETEEKQPEEQKQETPVPKAEDDIEILEL